jgi:hypothetical protein
MENANDGHEALRFKKMDRLRVFSLQESPGCHTNWPQAVLDAAIDEIISRADMENQAAGF